MESVANCPVRALLLASGPTAPKTGDIVPTAKTTLLPLARLLMSSLFIWDGVFELRNPGATIGYLTSLHVPARNLAIWVSLLIHLGGGGAILVGFKTRWAAALLALFCLGTAFGVHLPAGDLDNMVHFYKNLVMTGGFLYVVAFGAGGLSFDRDG